MCSCKCSSACKWFKMQSQDDTKIWGHMAETTRRLYGSNIIASRVGGGTAGLAEEQFQTTSSKLSEATVNNLIYTMAAGLLSPSYLLCICGHVCMHYIPIHKIQKNVRRKCEYIHKYFIPGVNCRLSLVIYTQAIHSYSVAVPRDPGFWSDLFRTLFRTILVQNKSVSPPTLIVSGYPGRTKLQILLYNEVLICSCSLCLVILNSCIALLSHCMSKATLTQYVSNHTDTPNWWWVSVQSTRLVIRKCTAMSMQCDKCTKCILESKPLVL